MKKLLFLAVLLTFSLFGFAQDENVQPTGWGSKPSGQIIEGYFVLGCSLPTFNGDKQDLAEDLTYAMYESTGIDFDFKPWPRICPMNVGAGIGVNLASWCTIMGGIELVPKGIGYHGKYNEDGYDFRINAIYKFNYLEFPLCVRLSTRSWRNPNSTFFYVKGGIAPAINVVSKLKVYVEVSDGSSSDSDTDTEEFEGVNKNDLCQFVAFGVGRHKASFFEVKYEVGTKGVLDPEISEYTFYNRSVSLNLVVSF